jgi:hypothetical protein
MSSESHVKFTITLANPDLDAEEQERETRNLLRDIKDLDVESAGLVEVAEVPEGGKSVGGFLVGALQAEVTISNCYKLLAWLGSLGNKSIELEVEFNGKKVKVKANGQKELTAALVNSVLVIKLVLN